MVTVSLFQRKGLLGPLGGLLASDIKLAICSHLEALLWDCRVVPVASVSCEEGSLAAEHP